MIDSAFFGLALAICSLPRRAFGTMHLPLPSLLFSLCALVFALHAARLVNQRSQVVEVGQPKLWSLPNNLLYMFGVNYLGRFASITMAG